MVQRVTQRMGDDELSHEQLPPLEPGDRFTRMEFERRYSAMPQCPKAELIEGAVYMPSPARFRRHGQPQAHLVWWLVHYEMGTPGIATGDNSTTRLDLDNEPQPDAVLLIEPARGGQALLAKTIILRMLPELVAEVAASSASIDLHTKFHVYRRNGVREYLVWRVLDQEVDWFVLRTGQYERLQPDAQGFLCSEVFPGLWLDTAALLRGDLASVLTAVQHGLASPEHAAFVTRLSPGTQD